MKLKLMSYIFISSFLIMYIEIIGAKLLTPILGGSHVIWITQILITLISLSIGSFLSIKLKTLEMAGKLLMMAGIYSIAMLLNLNKFVSIFEDLNIISLSLTLAILLYAFPLMTLSMLFPLVTKDLQDNHDVHLGVISSIGTIGSIIGTLATYFVIVLTSNLNILFFSSIFIVFFGYTIVRDFKIIKSVGIWILIIISWCLLIFNGNNVSDKSIVFYKNTHFGEIIVKKEGLNTVVYNDRLVQNGYNQYHKGIHLFTYALTMLPEMIITPKSALILGLGIGITAKDLKDKNIKVDAIEINPEMIKLAKKTFDLAGVNILEGDSRYLVKKNNQKYDLIIHDCFLVDSVPKYLLTQEALFDIKKLMTNKSIIAVNTFGVINPNDYMTNSTFNTLKAVFKYVKVYSLNNYNVYFLASDSMLKFQNYVNFEKGTPIEIQNELLVLKQSEITMFNPTPLLTDNSSSIEFYDNRNREHYRKIHKLK